MLQGDSMLGQQFKMGCPIDPVCIVMVYLYLIELRMILYSKTEVSSQSVTFMALLRSALICDICFEGFYLSI